MGNSMKISTLREYALLAQESVFAFSEFAERSESFFDDCEQDSDFLRRYRKAWFELEIVNAVALEEWEVDGRPRNWAEKWEAKYKRDASEVVHELLKVVEGKR